MGHSTTTTNYTERLVLRNKNVYRVVNAHYKKTNLEVVKQIAGKKDTYFLRNMKESYISGWLFNDPNDNFTWYDRETKTYHDKYEIENWWKWKGSCSVYGVNTQTLDEIEELILKSKHKDFVYTFRAYRQYYKDNYKVWEIFDLLNAWLEDNRVEFLMKLGHYRLCLHTKQFSKMKKDKRSKVIKLLSENKGKNYRSWLEVNMTIKGITDYYLWLECNKQIELYKYLLKQKESCGLYRDYIILAQRIGHNTDDPYWKYPSHLREKHNELLRQEQAIKLAKEQAICDKIKRVAKKLNKLNTTIKGYEVSVASSIDDIKEQAEVLSQCLMYCDYYKKYADKKCILVFIKKDNKRLATAEIFYKKEKPLGQFYADEKDREKCVPNKTLKSVINTWINNTYLTSNVVCA